LNLRLSGESEAGTMSDAVLRNAGSDRRSARKHATFVESEHNRRDAVVGRADLRETASRPTIWARFAPMHGAEPRDGVTANRR
jgi:hypothetical protein